MWKRIAWAILVKLITSVDWDALIIRLLAKLEKEIKEQLGVSIGLAQLNLEPLKMGIEQVLSEFFGLNLDINGDGEVGFPEKAGD